MSPRPRPATVAPRALATAILLASALAMTACTSGGGSVASPIPAGSAPAGSAPSGSVPAGSVPAGSVPAASLAVGPQVGMVAPALSLVDFDGKPVTLADYAGKPVVLNYWASWCGPCRDEFPELKAALDAHGAEGLVVLGVLFKDDVAPARAFMEKQGATWPSLADPDNVGADTFRVVAPPTTFFIGRDGVVRDLQIGGMTADQLARHLETILQ